MSSLFELEILVCLFFSIVTVNINDINNITNIINTTVSQGNTNGCGVVRWYNHNWLNITDTITIKNNLVLSSRIVVYNT